MTTATVTRGGAWLIESTTAAGTFTPERRTDDHRLIAQTTEEFASAEVLPAVERLEQRTGSSPARSCAAAASLACWASTCPRRTAASSSTRSPR